MKILLCIVLVSLPFITWSQNTLKAVIKSESTNEPLAGASVTISSLNMGSATDSNGIAVINNIPNGTVLIEISYVGYDPKKIKLTFPSAKELIEIELEERDEEENPDVIVTATRTDRSIRNTPTRVEVIAGGEIGENISMRPGEIRMLLNETTGINTQQTSAVSNTANLRIQELDGRYTQILRDGFPLYSGLAEGLSLVQIAPLDLKQVEIIKGSSSTLYGGGAIAGLINLVSKSPAAKRETSFLVNGTSTKGLDLSGFYSARQKNLGTTLFVSRNSGAAYDPAGNGLTAIPEFQRYTVIPRFFIYGNRTNINAGASFITETRLGGNINYVKHRTPGYFEKNNSDRFTTQFTITHTTGNHSLLTFKNSYNHFNRKIAVPDFNFEGLQQSSFSELSWSANTGKNQWVAGANVYTDNFRETIHNPVSPRDFRYNTAGLFIQNTRAFSESVSIESGLRSDYTGQYGLVLLPRVSFLFQISDNLSSRLGGGMGYKTPSIFTEESEDIQFRNILPLNKDLNRYERSSGGNVDFTYRISFDEIKITVNPLFFYTRINHPLVLQTKSNGERYFLNNNGFSDSRGLDMSFRMSFNEIRFFTGYSYTLAQNHFDGTKSWYPLAPHHKLHFDLVYEAEGKFRLAFESYYTGRQQLNDGSSGRSYWLLGALMEKSWKHFSIFINGEDLNDARQTKWNPLFTGSIDNPEFRDVYTPLEGVTINSGIKLKW